MDKKNLDELFREKFKVLREVPDDKVWTAIENSLDKKRKMRVIPLWLKLGGVAAVLAIALVSLYPFEDTVNEIPTVTDAENSDDTSGNQNRLDTNKKKSQENGLLIRDVNEDGVANDSKDTGIENIEQYSNSDGDEALVSEGFSDNGKKDVLQSPKISKDAVVSNTKSSADKNIEKTLLTANEGEENTADADRGDNAVKSIPILKEDNADLLKNRIMDAIATIEVDSSKKTGVSKTNTNTKNQDGIAVTQKSKRIISEESGTKIVQFEIAIEDVDKADDNKKSIFEALEERADEEKIVEESGSRWSAGPSVAPVYFNAMGEGSPIDPGFSPNSKSGSTNLSYGLSVAYALTKKLSVRSGIYKAEYRYDTNNVGFSPTLAASTSGRLRNIDYAGSSENLALNSNASNLDSSENFVSEFSTLNSARDGTVAQQFGYLEVPLELDYALIDRRFGVNLVGGISSLFLIDNSVTLSSGELTTEIGEARNLNDLNFSTNIGFGVNYKFTPKVQLNIEPVFKYQLNTFSNVSGDFRPFSVGVYSGLNFKF